VVCCCSSLGCGAVGGRWARCNRALFEIVGRTCTVVLVSWVVWLWMFDGSRRSADILTISTGPVGRLRGVVRMMESLRE